MEDLYKFGNEYIYIISKRSDIDDSKYFLDYGLAIKYWDKVGKEDYTYKRKKIETDYK